MIAPKLDAVVAGSLYNGGRGRLVGDMCLGRRVAEVRLSSLLSCFLLLFLYNFFLT